MILDKESNRHDKIDVKKIKRYYKIKIIEYYIRLQIAILWVLESGL